MRVPDLNFFPVALLAGGKSSRMPQPKGLMRFKGRPWLEWQLDQLAACGMKDILVVLGYRSEEYYAAFKWLRKSIDSNVDHVGLRVRTVVNELPEYGPFTSIQTAGREFEKMGFQSSFILPVDVPCPDRDVWIALAETVTDACLPEWQSRGGHPVKLSHGFMRRLLALAPNAPDSRLDQQIHQLPKECVARLPVNDSKIVVNLNTPEDWVEWEKAN